MRFKLFSLSSEIKDGRHGRHLEIPFRTTPTEFASDRYTRFALLASAYLEYVPVLKLKVYDLKNGRHDVIL